MNTINKAVKVLARSHMLIPRLVELGFVQDTRLVLCCNKDQADKDIYSVVIGGTRFDDQNVVLCFSELGDLESCERRVLSVCGIVSHNVSVESLGA